MNQLELEHITEVKNSIHSVIYSIVTFHIHSVVQKKRMGNTFQSTSNDDGTSKELILYLMSHGDKQLPNKDNLKGLWLSYDMNGDNKLGKKEILSFIRDFFGVFCRIMEEERKKNKSPTAMQQKIYEFVSCYAQQCSEISTFDFTVGKLIR